MDYIKRYGLLAAGVLLLLFFAGYGLKSCGSSIKERVCKTSDDSGSSDSGSWWDVKPSPK